jgi:hypothetical protein
MTKHNKAKDDKTDNRSGEGSNPPNAPAQSGDGTQQSTEPNPGDPEDTVKGANDPPQPGGVTDTSIDRAGEFSQVREDGDEREMEIEGLHKKGKRDYFVLNLTDDPDALCAIKAYGEAIRNSNPDLAIELLRRAGVNVGRG